MTTNNCRIYPTPNGLPHIGHVYLALVNQHHARSTGGKLHIIFDDTQPYWIERVGKEQLRRNSEFWISDMKWMGIGFYGVTNQSAGRDWLMNVLRSRNYDGTPERPDFPYRPKIIGNDAVPYPWDDFLTVEKAMFDADMNVNLVIRGDDLIDEYTLYQSMWNKYVTRFKGPPPPVHVYLPRLRCSGGQLTNISKTEGGWTIKSFRDAGWQPENILDLLRKACLKDQAGPWSYDNIVPHPTLGEIAMRQFERGPLTAWLGKPMEPIHHG